jgi:hypothetical protein
MITLSIRYAINPNKLADFRAYAEAEQEPIRRSGGKIVGYFLPTDFAGATNEALGVIEFTTLAAYEQYRERLANNPEHKRNIARLEQTGAIVSMSRSILQRLS